GPCKDGSNDSRRSGPAPPARWRPSRSSRCGHNGWSDWDATVLRSEEHTSELQSLTNLVCRLLLEKKKKVNRQQVDWNHVKPKIEYAAIGEIKSADRRRIEDNINCDAFHTPVEYTDIAVRYDAACTRIV